MTWAIQKPCVFVIDDAPETTKILVGILDCYRPFEGDEFGSPASCPPSCNSGAGCEKVRKMRTIPAFTSPIKPTSSLIAYFAWKHNFHNLGYSCPFFSILLKVVQIIEQTHMLNVPYGANL